MTKKKSNRQIRLKREQKLRAKRRKEQLITEALKKTRPRRKVKRKQKTFILVSSLKGTSFDNPLCGPAQLKIRDDIAAERALIDVSKADSGGCVWRFTFRSFTSGGKKRGQNAGPNSLVDDFLRPAYGETMEFKVVK
jgi:hypothetical protein